MNEAQEKLQEVMKEIFISEKELDTLLTNDGKYFREITFKILSLMQLEERMKPLDNIESIEILKGKERMTTEIIKFLSEKNLSDTRDKMKLSKAKKKIDKVEKTLQEEDKKVK